MIALPLKSILLSLQLSHHPSREVGPSNAPIIPQGNAAWDKSSQKTALLADHHQAIREHDLCSPSSALSTLAPSLNSFLCHWTHNPVNYLRAITSSAANLELVLRRHHDSRTGAELKPMQRISWEKSAVERTSFKHNENTVPVHQVVASNNKQYTGNICSSKW